MGKNSRNDQMMVLLEDMREGIKLVAEGHSILERKIDENYSSLSKRMDENYSSLNKKMDDGFEEAKEELHDFRTEMDGFKNETGNNFKIIFEYLSRIDDELAEIKAEMEEFRKELKNKVDIERFEKLEKRIFAIEKRQLLLAK